MEAVHTTRARWFVVLAAAMWTAGSASAAAQTNPIQIENAKAGSTDWLLTRVVRHDDEIYELRLAPTKRHRGVRIAHQHQGGRDDSTCTSARTR